LAARAAVSFNGTEGWLRNDSIGRNIPGENNIAGRVTLRFKPQEGLDVTLKAEGSRRKNVGGLSYQDVNCPPPAPFVATGFCKAALGLGVPMGFASNTVSQNAQDILLDTAEYVLTANYEKLGYTLTSVSGYLEYHYNEGLDTDGTPVNLLTFHTPEDYHQFSQEFRIASPANQPFEYLGGLYFHVDRLRFNQDSSYSFLTPMLTSVPPLASLIPYLPLGQKIDFSQPESTYSGFGSATWSVTRSLKLSAALRATWDKKRYDWSLYYGTATEAYGGIVPLAAAEAGIAQSFANSAGLGAANTLRGSRDDHSLLPSALVQYSVTQDATAYFSYAKGFKAGGFNGADITGSAANLPFAPEHADAYEVGLKSEWFHRALLLNFDLFRSDYNDLQVATNLASRSGAIFSLVRNAASSRTQGLELEAVLAPSRSIALSANFTYDDARYVSYRNVAPNPYQQMSGQTVQDLSGRPTEFAPEWSGSLAGSYVIHLRDPYQLTTELTTIFSSGYFLTGNDDPTLRQSAYARLDVRLSLEDVNQQWALDLIGKNLTDQNVITFGIIWPSSPGSVWLQKEEPRNVAIQARFRW
jgi:iron complex outermembrane receptor protein